MRATYGGGTDGWIDDGIASTRTWGFDLTELTCPVSRWYGAEDVLGPGRIRSASSPRSRLRSGTS